MANVQVLVAGFGVVGKRIADAVHAQDDMDLCGIIDVAPTSLVKISNDRGYPLFAATSDALAVMRDNGLKVEGDASDIFERADIVVDAAPAGITPKNVPRYEKEGKPFIVNGGEKHSLTGFSFNAFANYRAGLGLSKTRVVSCNTTSLCRILVSMRTVGDVEDAFGCIVRRGADAVQTSQGPINAIVPVLSGPSHHAADVKTVIQASQ